jgi:ergothioneine biosynthesis protein EgtB
VDDTRKLTAPTSPSASPAAPPSRLRLEGGASLDPRRDIDRDALARRYEAVRARTEALAAPLSPEDMVVQSMPDASPTKWHLAHTTWFFEEFVLARFDPEHAWRDPRWRVLYNSYYEAAGPRHPRAARGLLSRPSLDAIREWRARVDARMLAVLATAGDEALAIARLGTHHEEQHQELLLTDVKHALAQNPLRPEYAAARSVAASAKAGAALPMTWVSFEERIASLGHDGPGFAFDNEGPHHRALVGPFAMASRLVTNAEYAAFIEDGGYRRADLWLSDGWATVKAEGWSAPLYWERGTERAWRVFTLRGLEPLEEDAPVTHVSLFEADAYARWAGARLPTEQEWEVAATQASREGLQGNFLDAGRLAAAPAGEGTNGAEASASAGPRQLFGDAWEWTGSAYLPYPRFRPAEGALGEYNGKFMSGQMVLRGGSCFTPRDHLRLSYRNFFPPQARWQMTGIRMARD